MAFVHLHNHTVFSMLDGATRIQYMVIRAVELGMPAVAITDHVYMYGVPDLALACDAVNHNTPEYKTWSHDKAFLEKDRRDELVEPDPEANPREHAQYVKDMAMWDEKGNIDELKPPLVIKPIFGCEVYFTPDETLARDHKPELYHMILLAKNQEGYVNLMQTVSEAAVQGFVAGVNAALKLKGEEPMVLRRSDGYIGTLIDDLVTKGTNEPYRIMTSRSEYRLLHRQDNADRRLSPIGRRIGLISEEQYARVQEKYRAVDAEIRRLETTGVPESAALNAMLEAAGTAAVHGSARLSDLVRRPQIGYADLAAFDPDRPPLSKAVCEAVEIGMKYEGYIRRQEKQVEEFQREESRLLPEGIDYMQLEGLRVEARQKLSEIRPLSVGQASRISGVSPSDIAVLLIWLQQRG